MSGMAGPGGAAQGKVAGRWLRTPTHSPGGSCALPSAARAARTSRNSRAAGGVCPVAIWAIARPHAVGSIGHGHLCLHQRGRAGQECGQWTGRKTGSSTSFSPSRSTKGARSRGSPSPHRLQDGPAPAQRRQRSAPPTVRRGCGRAPAPPAGCRRMQRMHLRARMLHAPQQGQGGPIRTAVQQGLLGRLVQRCSHTASDGGAGAAAPAAADAEPAFTTLEPSYRQAQRPCLGFWCGLNQSCMHVNRTERDGASMRCCVHTAGGAMHPQPARGLQAWPCSPMRKQMSACAVRNAVGEWGGRRRVSLLLPQDLVPAQ